MHTFELLGTLMEVVLAGFGMATLKRAATAGAVAASMHLSMGTHMPARGLVMRA